MMKPHRSWYVFQSRRPNDSNFYNISAPHETHRGLKKALTEYHQGVIEEPDSEHRIIVVSRTVVISTEQIEKSEDVLF